MTKNGLTSNEMEATNLAEVSVSFHSWAFGSALGELRGTFGVHVARIAAAFKLDVEDRLASILPANADVDTGDDGRLFCRLHL